MKNKALLGQFVGKCCDGDVVNKNGMYLSRELFNYLINSDEYKTAIKNKYYIGFLGHPENCDDQNFKNACIIMTDMSMDSNGDITGTFDLVDTPVGRVVKSFIDAGVHFGISIRGVGDVANDGTVDPETFVFRGFDLVTFPAYEDCVPEFKQVAASTDAEQQKKYKKVCAAVKTNLSDITSSEAIEIIQDQFNEHSDEYKMLEERANELQQAEQDCDIDLTIQVLEQKVQGLTDAYCEAVKKLNDLQQKHQQKCQEYDELACTIKDMTSTQERVKQMVNDQNRQAEQTIQGLQEECSSLEGKVQASNMAFNKERKINAMLRNRCEKAIKASKDVKLELEKEKAEKNAIISSNLLSGKKIEASEKAVAEKEASIAALKAEARETVAAKTELEKHVSNLEADVEELNSKIEASEKIIFEYQQAYANSCAYAAGITVDNVPITSSTTVDQLRSYIYGHAGNSLTYSSVEASEQVNEFDDDMFDDDENKLIAL